MKTSSDPQNLKWMQSAIAVARSGIAKNAGGPFGAIIVQQNQIISEAHNEVVAKFDPTAHAEILAIQRAAKKLKKFHLSDCVLYATCEPCPMCLGAILWANIPVVYYGCSAEDAKNIGFADADFHQQVGKHKGGLQLIQIGQSEALDVFERWEKKEDKVVY